MDKKSRARARKEKPWRARARKAEIARRWRARTTRKECARKTLARKAYWLSTKTKKIHHFSEQHNFCNGFWPESTNDKHSRLPQSTPPLEKQSGLVTNRLL